MNILNPIYKFEKKNFFFEKVKKWKSKFSYIFFFFFFLEKFHRAMKYKSNITNIFKREIYK